MAEDLAPCLAMGEDANPEDLHLVNQAEAQAWREQERERLHKKCKEEGRQAEEAAQHLKDLDGRPPSELCLAEIHLASRVPGTSVSILSIELGKLPRLHTEGEHCFQEGQTVIVEGISWQDGAPYITSSTVARLLNGEHVVHYVDETTLSLRGLRVDSAVNDFDIDLTKAKVHLSTETWAQGYTPITHSVLQAAVHTATSSGLGHVLERLLAGVGSAWGGVQRWAGVVAGYLEPHEPPDASESESRQPSDGSEPEDGLGVLGAASGVLRSFSESSTPVPEASAKGTLDMVREAFLPPHWVPASSCHECMECSTQLRSLKCERADLPEDTVFSSPRHCRDCGRVICGTCVAYRARVPWHGVYREAPVCRACKPRVEGRNLCLLRRSVLEMKMKQSSKADASEPKPKPVSKPKSCGKAPGPAPPRGSKILWQKKSAGMQLEELQGEYADFLQNARQAATMRPQNEAPQGENFLQPDCLQILDNNQYLRWHVGSNILNEYRKEILQSIRGLQLKGNCDQWFNPMKQLLPLEEQFTEETVEKLEAVKPGDEHKLRQAEKDMRQLLQEPNLTLSWRILESQHELRSRKASLVSKCEAVRAALNAALDCSGGEFRLRSEVAFVIRALYEIMQPPCHGSLKDLVQRTEAGAAGKSKLHVLWGAGEKHAKAFVAALAPVLLLDSDAAAMQELLQSYTELSKRHEDLLSQEDLKHLDQQTLRAALRRMTSAVKEIGDAMNQTLELGRQFLKALRAAKKPEAKPCEDVSESSGLATDIGHQLLSLGQLAKSLQEEGVKFTRSAAPGTDGRQGSMDRARSSSDIPRATRNMPGVESYNRQDLDGSSSEATCSCGEELIPCKQAQRPASRSKAQSSGGESEVAAGTKHLSPEGLVRIGIDNTKDSARSSSDIPPATRNMLGLEITNHQDLDGSSSEATRSCGEEPIPRKQAQRLTCHSKAQSSGGESEVTAGTNPLASEGLVHIGIDNAKEEAINQETAITAKPSHSPEPTPASTRSQCSD